MPCHHPPRPEKALCKGSESEFAEEAAKLRIPREGHAEDDEESSNSPRRVEIMKWIRTQQNIVPRKEDEEDGGGGKIVYL